MNFTEMNLRELKEACERKLLLESRLKDVEVKIWKGEQRCAELRTQLEKEEKDVTELQTGGIHAFFKTVFRDRNEVLEKERLEAAAAGAKYETAVTDLAKLREQKQQQQKDLAALEGCEAMYQKLYAERKEALERGSGRAAERILAAEERIGGAKERLREIAEAERAADSVLRQIEEIQSALSSAENWGTFDLMGGGMLASMAKRGHMDHAEQLLPELQRRLERLSAELRDVSVTMGYQVESGGFLRFADYFFDGLFVDWMVQDQIHDFQEEMASTRRRVEHQIKHSLREMRQQAEKTIRQAEAEIEESVVSAE